MLWHQMLSATSHRTPFQRRSIPHTTLATPTELPPNSQYFRNLNFVLPPSHDDATDNLISTSKTPEIKHIKSHNGKGSAQVRPGRWPPEGSRMSHLVEDLCVAALKLLSSSFHPPPFPGRVEKDGDLTSSHGASQMMDFLHHSRGTCTLTTELLALCPPLQKTTARVVKPRVSRTKGHLSKRTAFVRDIVKEVSGYVFIFFLFM